MRYGYARISTEEQNEGLQRMALKRARCEKILVDKATGGTANRPALLRLLKMLKHGDSVTVWKLDRLGRSLRDLINIVDSFGKQGVEFRSLTEEINTATPGGKLTFHIFGAMAEFEHGLIKERTQAGVEAARSRGVKFGRKRRLTPQKVAQARKLIDQGERPTDVAESFGVGRSTLYRELQKLHNG